MEIDCIRQGDCMRLMKDLPDKSIDVVFTSPPYNRIRNDKYAHYDDTLEDYYGMLVGFTDESLRLAKDRVIVNIQQNAFNKREVFSYIGHYFDKISGVVIWTKTNPQPSHNIDEEVGMRSITNGYEYFFVLNEDGGEFKAYGTSNTINYITTGVNPKHFEGHGAVMREDVADWFIGKFTKEGDVVLDPFMGTGTTAVACVKAHRHYVGFELVKEYIDIATKRLKEAELLSYRLF